MELKVNGESMQLPEDSTVSDLLKTLAVDSRMLVVELNKEILEKGKYDRTRLQTGDMVEIVQFVGGG